MGFPPAPTMLLRPSFHYPSSPILSIPPPSSSSCRFAAGFARPISASRIHACPSFASKRATLGSIACAESQATNDGITTATSVGQFKRLLLPIIDRNPYLSEATRQATVTTASLAKRYGADITVVVIDEDTKESIADHDVRIDNIRWHLAEAGFEEFGLMERLGEGKRPAAVIGEVADDLGLDLVVLSMETIHSKHIDGNLLPEFLPCPVLLLPL